MIFECQFCHAKTAGGCSCINRQWAMPNIPYTAPLTEQRVREIVREEIAMQPKPLLERKY